MAVFKDDEITKDGRQWVFFTRYTDLLGKRKQYKSKKFSTKKEALEAERTFLFQVDNNLVSDKMTFEELYLDYYEFQRDKVKMTTMKTYKDRIKYLEILKNVNVTDFNINHFNRWKKELNKIDSISNSYKNMIYKFLKAILNYGTKWHNLNFTDVYSKMTNFTNPNEIKPEMQFYTHDEFQKFISNEKDLLFICLFELLYYCGLRKGELRGLTWKHVDFTNRSISIRQNAISNHIKGVKFLITTPKTNSSIRTLPIPKQAYNNLKKLYEQSKSIHGFNDSFFIFGHTEPIGNDIIRRRKNNLCKEANLFQIRIHDFRHSCASLLINNGANVTLVAKYLGHSKIDETLNTYSHMYKDSLNNLINIIDNL